MVAKTKSAPGKVANKASARGRGRPVYKPTAEDRLRVEVMRADGWDIRRVSKVMKIAPMTLMKHFPEEIEVGADAVRARILVRLATLAMQDNVSAARAFDNMTKGAVPPTAIKLADDRHDEEEVDAYRGLGKKEIADIEAKTAHSGTRWGDVLKH